MPTTCLLLATRCLILPSSDSSQPRVFPFVLVHPCWSTTIDLHPLPHGWPVYLLIHLGVGYLSLFPGLPSPTTPDGSPNLLDPSSFRPSPGPSFSLSVLIAHYCTYGVANASRLVWGFSVSCVSRRIHQVREY
ncbi:hypothetical protein F5X99DRAFT_164048 [Biscogniauxia marginata]|nr:hypothetical protein F5X99DRAFT_164048 [Biscogniauxia marginata]